MTQGLQFSLLFSGLDGLTTGDTAGLKSDMADSAAAQQAVAFRQILQDEQYSKTVRQGQTLAAASAQTRNQGSTVAPDSDVEDSDLAGQWLGLIRQSSDASAQLKQKAEMITQFVNVQSDADHIGPTLDEEAEQFLDSIDLDSNNAQLIDAGQQNIAQSNEGLAPLQKNDILQTALLKQESSLKQSTDNLMTQPVGSIAELDVDEASNNAAAETDELAPKQNAKQNVTPNSNLASTAPVHLPLATTVSDTDSTQLDASLPENTLPDTEQLASGSAAKAATSQVDLLVASESKDKQSESKDLDMSTLSASHTKVAQNGLFNGERNTDTALQDNVSNLARAAAALNQTKSSAEQKLAAQALAETATTAGKSDANTETGIDNSSSAKSEAGAQAMLANGVTADNKLSSEAITAATNKDNQQSRQNDAMTFNRQVEQVSRAESAIAVTSNLAEINVNLSGMTSGKDKSDTNLTDTGMVNTNKISVSKADKGADTADSQSEQQGQSRQDGRQFTFNRLEVALAQNTAQPAAAVATNSSVQVNDTAGVIARAESFATVLEQQNRPPSTVAAPSLAAQLKQLNLQQQDAAGQLRERVQLMVRQNVQVAEIRLDPAELGQMQIRVNLQQEQASVQFIVQQQHAKELLEQQMPRLRELLQQQGIQLGEGQVQQQTREERQQAEQRSAGGSQHNDDKQTGTDSVNQTTTVELSQSERLVDYYA